MREAGRRKVLVAGVVGVAALAIAGGVAFATIPDSGRVYTACVLKNVGTVRLIDTSLGASSLMGRCTALETQITWNQQGQKGDPGATGASPAVDQLASGDSHCPTGGVSVTDAKGPSYVCNGQDGRSFSGAFTSPNGLFSLTVTDGGVEIKGPDSTVTLPSAGGITIVSAGTVAVQGNRLTTTAQDQFQRVNHNLDTEVLMDESHDVAHDLLSRVGNDADVHVNGDRVEAVGSRDTLQVGGNRTESVSGSLNVRASGPTSVAGSRVTINGGGPTCPSAARVGDSVDAGGHIATGSPTVCVGP